MPRTVKFDLVTLDAKNGEFVIYFVETGPWNEPVSNRLRSLQEKLYDAIDAVIDGLLASKFPDSVGMPVRIQVDCHNSPPVKVADFVSRFNAHLHTDPEIQQDILKSPFVNSIRVVNGVDDMGRKFE